MLSALATAMSVTLLGAVLSSWALVALGLGGVVIVVAVSMNANRPSAQPAMWLTAVTFAALSFGAFALAVYELFFAASPLGTRLILALILLIVLTPYFVLMTVGLVYFAVTGGRLPAADRIESVLRRGNADIWKRRRRTR